MSFGRTKKSNQYEMVDRQKSPLAITQKRVTVTDIKVRN